MENNALLWLVAAAVEFVLIVALACLYIFKLKRLEKTYNDSFNEAETELRKIANEREHELRERNEVISLMIDLINTHWGYVNTKEVSYHLALKAALEKLPAEIRERIESKI